MDTNIQKYIAFVETVNLGSFTKAAEKLNYSQSGISRMINDLEKEWDLSLLERNKTGLAMTSDGQFLYSYIQELNNDYQKLSTAVDELNGLQSGNIRIGTFSSVATHWLPKMINYFKIDYPKINFELLLGDYHEIEKWLLNGRIDLGFIREPSATELETIELEDDPFMAILPMNNPFRKHKKFPIDKFDQSDFILLDKDGNSEINHFLEQNGITPNICLTTWDDYAVMSMVENGLGISILPKLILTRNPYDIEIKPLSKNFSRKIVLAVKDKKTISLASKRFLNYLKYR